MKSVLIYATIVGIAGAMVSFTIANKLANQTKKLERSTVK